MDVGIPISLITLTLIALFRYFFRSFIRLLNYGMDINQEVVGYGHMCEGIAQTFSCYVNQL